MLNTLPQTGRRLRRLVLGFALLGLAASFASAAPLCVVDATLQSYITTYNTFGNACQIGDKLFWGFSLADGALAIGAEPTADDIKVLPISGIVGISFNSGFWDISSSIPIDQIIAYQVATLSGQAIITDATLTIVGTLAGNGASGRVVETLTPPVAGSPITAALPNTVSVNIGFSGNPMSTFAVSNRLTLIGGSGIGDTAHISVIENDFTSSFAVPEPMTTLPVSAGLLIFGVALRKRMSRTAVKVPSR